VTLSCAAAVTGSIAAMATTVMMQSLCMVMGRAMING
jgi:hypothetical protein